ncbi:MAG: HD domain-containing protein [archaeon]|jgi:uncharacterized protein
MNKEYVIKLTEGYARKTLEGELSGHDYWHVYRVWKTAKFIAKKEKADSFIVELAALLHDIADWKAYDGDTTIGPRLAREWLESIEVDAQTISHVCEIINDLSFKGAEVKTPMRTLEGKIVQDADRLDAIGAIGIARTFAYGASKGREMYNPSIPPKKHKTFEEYKQSKSVTINHFYEKLLLLKDLMNTKTAKKLAKERHKFMEEFLDQFFDKWECK